MKHKHHDIMLQYIADTSLVVEYREGPSYTWTQVIQPCWNEIGEYRIKATFRPGDIITSNEGSTYIVCTALWLKTTYSRGDGCKDTDIVSFRLWAPNFIPVSAAGAEDAVAWNSRVRFGDDSLDIKTHLPGSDAAFVAFGGTL